MRANPIGRVVRLQVQTDHLKRASAPDRWYDPAPITAVPILRLDDGGVVGLAADGTLVRDVHHRLHPKSRHRGDNGVSVGFTSHYAAMRQHFGGQVIDGVAGENILVDGDTQTLASMGGSIVVATKSGDLRIGGIAVAEPCVEFSKFCLDRTASESVPQALAFLGDGVRGFYATFDPTSAATEISVGDTVYPDADRP